MPMEIQELIEAAGGEIVGKVRLQKVVYLLDQLGMNSGFSYEYHHYGPYSSDLAKTVDDGVFSRRITEEVKRRSDGVPYSVFKLPSGEPIEVQLLGGLTISTAKAALKSMQQRDATVLELASTIHWLVHNERIGNWQSELRRRKGIKTANGRVDQAVDLLDELGVRV